LSKFREGSWHPGKFKAMVYALLFEVSKTSWPHVHIELIL